MVEDLPASAGDMGSIPGPGRFHMLQGNKYWSGLPCPSPGDCPSPGIKPGSPELLADSLLSDPPGDGLTFVPWSCPWWLYAVNKGDISFFF